ncbi:50S ribosomal protein L28 [Buchnera aphidicola]|uniref:Large ribosomal subunit protein bL28 n=1 Tax=Buchnera aphidicola str. Ua (Uroleucon ambrosiae) TaxID=1005057 RepID=G2LNX1_BUCUM|nr:50S ribosomal protein L28 [Buchnera aphidicola]AEO07908.1 50S ribosomal protein L28 [Buchnera aphidicola str. Ua (Uroleucon ambrosiae)]
MSRICQVTGKKRMIGNNRSHAMNATKRKFLINIQYHRFWVADQKRFVKLRVSTNGMRCIDKNGIEAVIQKINLKKLR